MTTETYAYLDKDGTVTRGLTLAQAGAARLHASDHDYRIIREAVDAHDNVTWDYNGTDAGYYRLVDVSDHLVTTGITRVALQARNREEAERRIHEQVCHLEWSDMPGLVLREDALTGDMLQAPKPRTTAIKGTVMTRRDDQGKRVSPRNVFDEQLQALRQTALRNWSSLTEAVDVPADIAAAFLTQRPELLAIAQPRAMNATEVGSLYKVIRVLIETNHALQAHAALLGGLTSDINSQHLGITRKLRQLEHAAFFRTADETDETDNPTG